MYQMTVTTEMYDLVRQDDAFPQHCGDCGSELSGWQTKSGASEYEEVDYRGVSNFYTLCNGCRSFYEYTRKPAQTIAEFDLCVSRRPKENQNERECNR